MHAIIIILPPTTHTVAERYRKSGSAVHYSDLYREAICSYVAIRSVCKVMRCCNSWYIAPQQRSATVYFNCICAKLRHTNTNKQTHTIQSVTLATEAFTSNCKRRLPRRERQRRERVRERTLSVVVYGVKKRVRSLRRPSLCRVSLPSLAVVSRNLLHCCPLIASVGFSSQKYSINYYVTKSVIDKNAQRLISLFSCERAAERVCESAGPVDPSQSSLTSLSKLYQKWKRYKTFWTYMPIECASSSACFKCV